MSGYQTLLQLSALAGFWGAFAANAVFEDSSDFQWQVPVIVQLVPGAILLIGSFYIPETPQFLASREKWQAAGKAIAWLHCSSEDDPQVLLELHDIKASAELTASMQSQSQTSFLKEAIKKPNRKRLGVGIGLMIAQNMVGLNALNYCKLYNAHIEGNANPM